MCLNIYILDIFFYKSWSTVIGFFSPAPGEKEVALSEELGSVEQEYLPGIFSGGESRLRKNEGLFTNAWKDF